jgi:hypothetical protein
LRSIGFVVIVEFTNRGLQQFRQPLDHIARLLDLIGLDRRVGAGGWLLSIADELSDSSRNHLKVAYASAGSSYVNGIELFADGGVAQI